MNLLVDMNLSAQWIPALAAAGHTACHWANVGDPRASDAEIIAWARSNDYVVFTHDLDFTTILALTRLRGPSVVQIRTQDVLPEAIGGLVMRVLAEHEAALVQGAVVSIDEMFARVRVLPIRQ